MTTTDSTTDTTNQPGNQPGGADGSADGEARAATIDIYLAAWNEGDPAARADLVARAFAPAADLADPPFAAHGHDEISAIFGAVQEQFPGHRFHRISLIDHHHDVARYAWTLVGSDGAVALDGLDVVTFDADGLIARVTGFLGELQPA